MQKILRITTVPISLSGLLTGQIEFMSKYFDLVVISSDKAKLEEYANEIDVRSYEVPFTRKITPLKDLLALYKLYRIILKEKPFIVHTHTPKAGTIGMLAAKLAGVPHRLHTIAGLPLLVATGKKRMLLDLVEKLTYACATKIYPNSKGLSEIILKNKFTHKSKLQVIAQGSSNGIDTSYFDPQLFDKDTKSKLRDSLSIGYDENVFVFLGRFVKDKGINELVAAFLKLTSTNNKVKLLLVGAFENDLDPLLPQTVQIMENNPNIRLIGWASDVRPYLSVSNFLAFPSYREGFPNTVMQAGAMGIPAIVTDINGCNEIIANEVNGLVIPVQDETALLNAMQYVIKNVSHVQKMKNNTREMIVNRFERNYVWQELLKEYRNLSN